MERAALKEAERKLVEKKRKKLKWFWQQKLTTGNADAMPPSCYF